MSTAAARAIPAARACPRPDRAPSALEVFSARCEARALLWQAGEINLHDAVDELQASAVRDGLGVKLGQDEVQRLMAEAFAPVRDDLVVRNLGDAWSAPSWRDAAIEYHQARGKRTLIVETEPERLARAHRLLADNVSLERAWADVSRPAGVAASTLMAAKYLVREGDRERLRRWFVAAAPTTQERTAILQHLERRRKAQAA
jgi:hypothetical protein